MPEILEWEHFKKTVGDFLGKEPGNLTRDTDLYDDIGIDSLGLFSLGMTLIKTYGCKIPLNVVSSIRTIGNLFDEMMNRYLQVETNKPKN